MCRAGHDHGTLTASQELGYESARRLLASVVSVYGRAPQLIVTGQPTMGAAGLYANGTIFIASYALTSEHRDALLAHEVGHFLLGHERSTGQPAQWREMDANAKGVEVLERAGGYDSSTAFYRLARKLQSQVDGPAAVGHESGACAELRDLMRRFPDYPVGLPAACLGP